MLPLLAIAAWSGTGKTTLLKQLLPLLITRGIRPGLIKHTHHDMDVDKPGKDSYELRKAGAVQTIVASQKRWALITEIPDNIELNFAYLASRMEAATLDIILVEGFKHEAVPKILLYRSASGKKHEDLLLDSYVIAIASDVSFDSPVPLLDINHPQQIADFICRWVKKEE